MLPSALIILTVVLSLDVAQAQSGDGAVDDVDTPMTFDFNYKHKECYFSVKGTCNYRGKKHELLDQWMTDDCHFCTCHDRRGVLCCNTIKLPVDWPPRCTPMVDKRKCKVRLVRLKDPSLPCPRRLLKRSGGKNREVKRKRLRHLSTPIIIRS